MVTHPFAPVVDENCRTLILGSFPSVKSRENGFYYGHPQNRFWQMLAAVYAEDAPESIAEKTSLPVAAAFLRRNLNVHQTADTVLLMMLAAFDGAMDALVVLMGHISQPP